MSKTLLLADDSVVIQKLVGLSFANEDVEIIATDNGDDAIARAREVNPDVVLADVVMPGKSGYEVCEAIKQDPDLAHVPVLLLTGTFESFDEARAAAAGANGQITKPFEAQSLVERVNSVMREAAAVPPVIDLQSAPQDNTPTMEAESPATSSPGIEASVGIASFGGTSDQEAFAAPLSSETKGSNDAPSYGRRVTDTETNTAGLDTSESDFFDNQHTPQLNANELDDAFAPDLDAHASSDADDEEILLDSPSFEVSQDLAADFSDSPLAAYVGAADPATGTSPVADADFDDQAETVVSLPPMAPARDAFPKSTDASLEAPETPDDGLGLGDSLPLPDLIPALPPVDLDLDSEIDSEIDSDFDSGTDSGSATDEESQRRIANATILVGRDDVNASTSPSYAIPIDDAHESEESDEIPLAEMVASSESSRNQLDALTVHAPSERIDQDAAFGPSPTDPTVQQGAAFVQPSGVADLDASLNRETQDALHIERSGSTGPDSFSVPAAEAMPSAPDPLHFGPTSVGGEDIDFAFDVSEQREITDAEALSDDASIETGNISESQLIGRDTSELEAPVASAEEALVGDYDVSSSDLATAASDYSEAAPTDNSHESSEEESAEIDTSFSSPLTAPFSSGHYAVGRDSTPSRSLDEDNGDDPESRSAFAPEPMQTGNDAEIELGSHPADDRRVSDLSPLMEQRIQETLEKVAWEAFSDLSETIVKQVISRVEQVAWDVIPEMAETLVREEIRRMKGEDD